MGGGSWTTCAFRAYAGTRGRDTDDSGRVTTSYASAQDMYVLRGLSEGMDPRRFKVRECRDSDEHPATLPVILAIDVTGSMGQAAIEVAKSLDRIVTSIAQEARDAEFCVMGIGDGRYDRAPVQMSQFESDVRIARALDDIWFEGGGGGNNWESYTAAWYMASRRTDLDIWKRGGKGVLITFGDEPCNPWLEYDELHPFVDGEDGASEAWSRMKSGDLYKEVSEKYGVYHVHVAHGRASEERAADCVSSFRKYLPDDHVSTSSVDGLPDIVSGIVLAEARKKEASAVKVDGNGMIDW